MTDQSETDKPETDTLEPEEVDQEPEVVPETEGPLVTAITDIDQHVLTVRRLLVS